MRSWSATTSGFDIWAHKHALDHVGAAIAEFDEVVLTNDTWFGPVRPYAPVLERMGERAVHFWGMTDHAREEPNPFTQRGCPAVPPAVLLDRGAARDVPVGGVGAIIGGDLPPMPSYFDAVLEHEAMFTEHFADAGFHASTSAFPVGRVPDGPSGAVQPGSAAG